MVMLAKVTGLKRTGKREKYVYELKETFYSDECPNFRDGENITISFVNGVFDKVKFPFSGQYTRNQWRILRFIEEEISRLEDDYKNKEKKATA